MKENPDIRLEIVINAAKDEMPVIKWEFRNMGPGIGIYFRNKNIDSDTFASKGFDMSDQVFKPCYP